MKHPDPNWTPDPQLLAAYFDGELEGRDDVADMRVRLEAWLEQHPEAAAEYAQHQQLLKLMRDTTPADPGVAAWEQTIERIDAERKRPVSAPRSRRPWIVAGIATACVLLLCGLLAGPLRSYLPTTGQRHVVVIAPQPKPPEVEDFEVLAIATAAEITILRIEDADIHAMVVGTFPVSGALELASSGEVCIKCKCPRVVVRQDPPHRPMVWGLVAAGGN